MKLQKKPPLCEILATQLIELLLQYFAFLAPLLDYGYAIVNCILSQKSKGTTTCLPLAYDYMRIESFSPNFCGFLLLCT